MSTSRETPYEHVTPSEELLFTGSVYPSTHRAPIAPSLGLVTLFITASACDSDRTWSTDITTIMDTVHIDGPPMWGQEVNLVEEMRIGTVDGEEVYEFGNVTSLTVRADDDFFVYDLHAQVIRQFNASGNHVRNVGRLGAGPGEYNTALLQTLPNNRLAVFDPDHLRIVVFDTTASVVAHHLVERTWPGKDVFFVDTTGVFYVKMQDLDAPWESGANAPPPLFFQRLSANGENAGTISLPPADREEPSFVWATAAGYLTHFVPERFMTLGIDGMLVVAHNSDYALDLSLPDGGGRRLVRSVAATRVKNAEKAMWETRSVSISQRSGNRAFANIVIPDTKPFFRDLFVDADGRIWVDRYVEAFEVERPGRSPVWREPPTFDVLGTTGEFYGTVVLPQDTRMMYSRGRTVWGVQEGSLDESYIVRWRIE